MDHQSLVRIIIRPLTDPEGPLSQEILEKVSRNVDAIAGVIEYGMPPGSSGHR